MTPPKQRVLELVRSHHAATGKGSLRKNIARATKLSHNAVHTAVNELVDVGVLSLKGPGVFPTYAVKVEKQAPRTPSVSDGLGAIDLVLVDRAALARLRDACDEALNRTRPLAEGLAAVASAFAPTMFGAPIPALPPVRHEVEEPAPAQTTPKAKAPKRAAPKPQKMAARNAEESEGRFRIEDRLGNEIRTCKLMNAAKAVFRRADAHRIVSVEDGEVLEEKHFADEGEEE